MSDHIDPDVERFLLLLAARRSPRTVDAYRRDLASFAASIDGPVASASTEQIETWLAAMRADAQSRVLTRDFEGALRRKIAAGHSAVIAEIKKASQRYRWICMPRNCARVSLSRIACSALPKGECTITHMSKVQTQNRNNT